MLVSCIGPGDNTDIINKIFPSVKGIDLMGNTVLVPESLQGNRIVIAIGFKREHQKEVDSWSSYINPIIQKDNSIRFYVLSVIAKTNFIRRMWINNAMRFGVSDKEERKHTITVYTDQAKFAKYLNMELNQAYLVVLDKNKNIVKTIEGAANPDKIKMLNCALNLRK